MGDAGCRDCLGDVLAEGPQPLAGCGIERYRCIDDEIRQFFDCSTELIAGIGACRGFGDQPRSAAVFDGRAAMRIAAEAADWWGDAKVARHERHGPLEDSFQRVQ